MHEVGIASIKGVWEHIERKHSRIPWLAVHCVEKISVYRGSLLHTQGHALSVFSLEDAIWEEIMDI